MGKISVRLSHRKRRTHPVIRRRDGAVRELSPRVPNVVIGVRFDLLQALLEPFVLVGRMIRDEVQDHLQ